MPFFSWFDTGGSESAKDLTVIATAGVCATGKRWGKFDKGWTAALAEEGLTELHMKYFAHSTGQYKKWKGDEPRRSAFLSRMTQEIKGGVNKAFVTIVIMPDYNEINTKYQLTEMLGGAYSVAQTGCIIRSLDWLYHHKDRGDKVSFFVEKGDTGQDSFMEVMRREKNIDPIILPRIDINTGRSYTPFEAADLIAYEYRLEYEKAMKTGRRRTTPRASLAGLRRHIPLDVAICDTAALQQFCDDLEIQLR